MATCRFARLPWRQNVDTYYDDALDFQVEEFVNVAFDDPMGHFSTK